MSGTIVVGSDGSAPSRSALSWGVHRAAQLGYRVVLCHVLDPETQGDGGGRRSVDELLADLGGEAEGARRQPGGNPVAVESLVLEGRLVSVLTRLAGDADLLVVGTHKTGFLQGRAFASRVSSLVDAGSTPVAFIPDTSEVGRSGVIVGVADDTGSEAAVRWAAAEAARTGEPLTLVASGGVAARLVTGRGVHEADFARLRIESLLERNIAIAAEIQPGLPIEALTLRRGVATDLVGAARTARLLVVTSPTAASPLVFDVLLNISSPTVVLPTPWPDAVVLTPDGAHRSAPTSEHGAERIPR